MAQVRNSEFLKQAGVFDLDDASEEQIDVIDKCFTINEIAILMLMAKRFELDASSSGPLKISPGFF